MPITSKDIFDVMKSSKYFEALDDVQKNRVYCKSAWDLGITVGKPAYRKFVRHNGRRDVPTRRGLSPVGFPTSVEIAKVVVGNIDRELKPSTSTSETAGGKLRHGSIKETCNAIPTVVVKASKPDANNPSDAFYKAVARRTHAGATLSQAVMATLTPEAKSLLGTMVKAGIVESDAIPGIRVRVA